MGLQDFITDCEDMANEYMKLAKDHKHSVWGQAYYCGVANTLTHICYCLGIGRSPKVTAKEKLLGSILQIAPNLLNVNCASEKFYGSEEKQIAFEANQDREVIERFLNYCEKYNVVPNKESAEACIQWVYYDDSEEEEND